MKKIRIPIVESELTDLTLVSDYNGNGSSGSVAFTLLGVDIATELPAYHSNRYNYPCAAISFEYSDNLTGKLSTAISSLLANYYSAAARAGLITAPCRYRAQLRYGDGSRIIVGDNLLIPNSAAPQLVAHDLQISGNQMSCFVEIRNQPKRPCYALSGSFATTASGVAPLSLEFYATSQAAMAPTALTTAGTVTEEVDGVPTTVIPYTSYDSEYILRTAQSATDFSLVGSLLVEDLSTGAEPVAVPLTAVVISGDEEGSSIFSQSRIHVMTPPLDLGYPELEKRMRGVTLRGIFPRDELQITLYGSHHRENWRKLATARGAHIRLLCGIRYRWLRLEIETPLRAGDSIDALTCVIEN
jgi:hypothetical protein